MFLLKADCFLIEAVTLLFTNLALSAWPFSASGQIFLRRKGKLTQMPFAVFLQKGLAILDINYTYSLYLLLKTFPVFARNHPWIESAHRCIALLLP